MIFDECYSQTLVVSQWTGCLTLVSDYLTENGIPHVKYVDPFSPSDFSFLIQALQIPRRHESPQTRPSRAGIHVQGESACHADVAQMWRYVLLIPWGTVTDGAS